MGDLRINRPRRIRTSRPPEISASDIPGLGHNGGPPLDHIPEWGDGIGNYFLWRAASEAAFKKVTAKAAEAPPKRTTVPGVKEQVTPRIDQDVLEHFRQGGPGWQDRINEALRKAAGK